MINMLEYDRFRHLQFSANTVQLANLLPVFAGCTCSLPDGQQVKVKHLADPTLTRYDYALTKFGVVALLSENGELIDKTELCKQLDTALWAQLNCSAQGFGTAAPQQPFLRGKAFAHAAKS